MFSVYLECEPGQFDELSADLYERGTLGILELASGMRAWFNDGTDVDDLVERFDGVITGEPVSDNDWVQRTEDSFPAIPVGQRFWLAPSWNQEPPPPGRERLEITPGMACGTGWHECTQMCIEYLERFVTPGCSVLDVGTGSGILSVVARLLGAGLVISCDIDPEAAVLSRDRLASNSVYTGSADAAASARFDIVVANISPEVVRSMEEEFRRAAREGGVIIVSGFGDYPLQRPPSEQTRRGEWLCSIL